MERCIICNKKEGFFTKISKEGYCNACIQQMKTTKLAKSSEELADMVVSGVVLGNKKDANKVKSMQNAYEILSKNEKASFDRYYKKLEKARELEKGGYQRMALEIYLNILETSVPLGTLYYERPCIILEREKRYQEAIKICNMAINRIERKMFNADVEDFEKRKARLVKKDSQK